MKILIFSDSHGNAEPMKYALRMHRDAEVCFFLGDGLRDLEEVRPLFPGVMFFSVAGNCDWFSANEEKTGTVTLEGKRILYTHGHLFGAKGGYGGLIAEAKRQKAEIVLFGHTHIPEEQWLGEEECPHVLFNPGSVGMGTDGYRHFGLMEIRENGVLLSHGKI